MPKYVDKSEQKCIYDDTITCNMECCLKCISYDKNKTYQVILGARAQDKKEFLNSLYGKIANKKD